MDPVLANLVSTQTNLTNEMNQLKVNIATYDLMINDLRQSFKNINKFQLDAEIKQCKQQVLDLCKENKVLESTLSNEKASRSNLMSSLTNVKEQTESLKKENDKNSELMSALKDATIRRIDEEKFRYTESLQLLSESGNIGSKELVQSLKNYCT